MTSWVMVPCPEELVDEVQRALMRLSVGEAGWNDEGAAALVATLEGDERSLVIEVAEASVALGHLSYRDASRQLGLEEGHILHLVTAVNHRSHRASLPGLLFTGSEVTPGGDADSVAVPVLSIVRPIAVKLLDLVRASSEPASSEPSRP